VVEPRTKVVFSSQFYPIQMPADSDKLVLEFFQDITQQKRLQQELIQSEKLAGIGTLASGIAHEINNPLSGIIGTAEIMLDEIEPESKLYEFTEDIIRYSESAAEIIQDLNKYSRHNGRGHEQVDIIDILENSLTMAKRGMDFDNITVRKRYEELPTFEANPNELQQIFLNIIINGIQAMKGSGELTLSCDRMDGNARVSIRDTGYGIPVQEVDNVFTPFYTTKPPGKGTGLGLSVSHQLVQKMGGRIQIQSDIGRGTNFEIFIPLSEEVTRRIRFVKADTKQVIEDVFFLQRKILIGEKGYTEETIRRKVDEIAVHFVAYKGLQPVGTVTCITPDMTLPIDDHFPLTDHQEGRRAVEIDRLAVLREERGSIIPLGLMTIAYLYARANSAERVFLDVFSDEKKHISMYRKLGFQCIGDYTSPLPVTVMMLDQQTDYEKKAQRMEHFVRPFMARLKKYLQLPAADRAAILAAMEEVVSSVPTVMR
jgi:nitrogen-specific signal transduction histidine kinase